MGGGGFRGNLKRRITQRAINYKPQGLQTAELLQYPEAPIVVPFWDYLIGS